MDEPHFYTSVIDIGLNISPFSPCISSIEQSESQTLFVDHPHLRARKTRSHCSEKSANDAVSQYLSEDTSYTDSGEENSENSLIWHTYNEEVSKADSSMLDASHREIDVLLVFTGLFSAVLTTFIIQAYQMMVADPADKTNEILLRILAIQASASGTSNPPIERDPVINPSGIEIHWVNGLWFAALACSLSTALISMLAKQWLHAYTRDILGSPRDRARKRQRRYMHFRSWHTLAVINSLPLLLHAALLLFFSGIIVMLWSGELAISLATMIIVALAYIFYCVSMWISLVSPDCPYQHPISAHLHHWWKPAQRKWYRRHRLMKQATAETDLEKSADFQDEIDMKIPKSMKIKTNPIEEDILDASALSWLLEEATSTETVICQALQAIAGFPRDFTGYELLRGVGAVEMVLERFEACFQLDTTLGMEWYIKDPHVAEKYCRAWMRLTYQTKFKWPQRLDLPLRLLCDLTDQPGISATATCVLALSSLERYGAQGRLLAFLSRHVEGEIKLSWYTQYRILDTLLECIALWELPATVIVDVVSRAVPLLIRMLYLLGINGPSTVRHAIYLNLFALTGNFLEQGTRQEESRRKEVFWQVSVQTLSEIAEKPMRYGVIEEPLLDIVAFELARFANILVLQPHNFTSDLCNSAKSAFMTLYLDNRIDKGNINESMLADVLHIMYPPLPRNEDQQGPFTCLLINTLSKHKQPKVICNALRLLDVHLSFSNISSNHAFLNCGGLKILLHIANTGSIDGRRLQMDSLRTLCTFVRSSAGIALGTGGVLPSEHFDAIFSSTLLQTFCAVVINGRWWLPDIAQVWAPALVRLCQVRPYDPNWQNVEQVFGKYADLHQGELGHATLMNNIYRIRELRRGLEEGAGRSFFEDDLSELE